jgi:SNF2 family DNA or RNA helicase
MLRRTLVQEGEKNPRLKLPSLKSEIIYIDFEKDEEKNVYKRIEEDFQTRIEHTPEGCRLYSEALQGILRCRQACSHWKLIQASESLASKRKRSRVDDGCVVELSSKFTFICNDIAKHPLEKVLIFATWTLEINMLVAAIEDMGISALKFDGTMTKEARETTLYNFRETEGIRVLVVQIQSGGVGLNLQCATRIYITSPTWNPTHEIQAISRSHRLGQTQIVQCFRLVVRGTIEERMLEIQNQKMALIADALNDDDLLQKMAIVDFIDIKALFRS